MDNLYPYSNILQDYIAYYGIIWNKIPHRIFLLLSDSNQFKKKEFKYIDIILFPSCSFQSCICKNVWNLVVTIEDKSDRKMIYVCLRHWCRRNILSMPLGQSSYQCEANIFSLSFGTAKGFSIYDIELCHRYSILSLILSSIPSLVLSLFSLNYISYFLLCEVFMAVLLTT